MDPITLALLGLPQVFKLAQSSIQSAQADKLRVQDTTTPAEREALGLARQSATAQLPGYGAAVNAASGATNNALAAGTRAGSSASSVLGLLTAADANQQQALAGLQTRSDAFHQQGQRELQSQLMRQAQHQERDLETFDRSKAALREASSRNAFSALDGASQIGGYALGTPGQGVGMGGYGLPTDATIPLPPPGFAPEVPGRVRASYGRTSYGVPDYYSGAY